MANEVSICNLALSRIGEDGTITSLDPPEGSEQASACAIYYPVSLGVLLESHDWRFATRRVSQPTVSDAELYGWKSAVSLPANCLRVVDVREVEDERHIYRIPSARFVTEMQGDSLIVYSDCVNPIVRYVMSNPSVGIFPPLFVDALAWHLAASLAGRVIKSTQGAALVQHLVQNYQAALHEAAKQDAKGTELPIHFVPDWIKVR